MWWLVANVPSRGIHHRLSSTPLARWLCRLAPTLDRHRSHSCRIAYPGTYALMSLQACCQAISYTVGFYLRAGSIIITDVAHKRYRFLPFG
jgi:hypothetical protein